MLEELREMKYAEIIERLSNEIRRATEHLEGVEKSREIKKQILKGLKKAGISRERDKQRLAVTIWKKLTNAKSRSYAHIFRGVEVD